MHWRVLPSPWSMPMPELGERAEEGQLFGGDLAGAEPGQRVGAVPALDAFEALHESGERAFPSSPAPASPRALRRSGVVARSAARSGASASQPLGQAMPRLTG